MQDHLEVLQKELESGEAQLFDVREQGEWDAGHLTQAKLVPLSALDGGAEPEGVDKDKKTYLHCRSGQRVMMAAPLLESMGFSEVIPLQEGFDDLVSEGFSEA